MKIGVFGGTFNPVHLGHLNCLKSVAEQAGLDKMIVMPDRIPPHKQAEDLASSEDRLNMCRLAFADIPCVEISDWELKTTGKRMWKFCSNLQKKTCSYAVIRNAYHRC